MKFIRLLTVIELGTTQRFADQPPAGVQHYIRKVPNSSLRPQCNNIYHESRLPEINVRSPAIKEGFPDARWGGAFVLIRSRVLMVFGPTPLTRLGGADSKTALNSGTYCTSRYL